MTTSTEPTAPDTEDRDVPTVFAWCALGMAAGFICAALYKLAGVQPLGIPAVVLLLGSGVTAALNGWWIGTAGGPPSETRGVARARESEHTLGLVGRRIWWGPQVFTVLDDSAGGDRRRRTVVAADAAGRVGLLFVGFDRRGQVVEAATEVCGWAPARAE